LIYPSGIVVSPYLFKVHYEEPFELCWSKVKAALRAAKARTLDALVEAVAQALRSISFTDIQNWFAHCGYVLS